MSDRTAFLAWVAVLWVGTFLGAALGAPPDPLTQLYVLVPGLLLALPLAYWLSYRDGMERLRDR
ncbi:DUF7534 family protein [Halorarius litoreus]|uniref:DUF7534 family protein n=1 Tax=Halorarius litoreus TaxID=2962676 RepID=UPI0020CC7DA6|nr:hypothetical protein [Halorarius litoreus]